MSDCFYLVLPISLKTWNFLDEHGPWLSSRWKCTAVRLVFQSALWDRLVLHSLDSLWPANPYQIHMAIPLNFQFGPAWWAEWNPRAISHTVCLSVSHLLTTSACLVAGIPLSPLWGLPAQKFRIMCGKNYKLTRKMYTDCTLYTSKCR